MRCFQTLEFIDASAHRFADGKPHGLYPFHTADFQLLRVQPPEYPPVHSMRRQSVLQFQLFFEPGFPAFRQVVYGFPAFGPTQKRQYHYYYQFIQRIPFFTVYSRIFSVFEVFR
jgi:hypothetical protein